jgi:hypothetical protein
VLHLGRLLGWKGLSGTNTLSYFENSKISVYRKLYRISPWNLYYKNFYCSNIGCTVISQSVYHFHTIVEPLTDSNGRILDFPTNIRLGWRRLKVENTLAYYNTATIITVKSFKEQTPGAFTKNFLTTLIHFELR